MSDLTSVALPGAEETFRILRRLVNLRPAKFTDSRLHGARDLDWQLTGSELEAHREYLQLDSDYLRVLTLKELPSETRPLLLLGLFDIPANFHVVMEWHPVGNGKARKEIASRRRHYHNSKTSFLSNLQDSKTTDANDNLVDDSKAAAVAELGNALKALGMEGNSAYDPGQVSVNGALGNYSVNGNPVSGVYLLLDGSDIKDAGNYGAALQNVNYDEVSEVKVNVSNFGAEVANGPVVVSAVTKAGGDHFHGQSYTYARAPQLDSADALGNGRHPLQH